MREEGESLLGRELRRNYVALLRVIAERGPCTHAELQESAPELSLGLYLKTLGQELRLVLYSVRFSSEQRAGLEAGGCICKDIVDFQKMLGPHERGPHGARPASPKVSGAE